MKHTPSFVLSFRDLSLGLFFPLGRSSAKKDVTELIDSDVTDPINSIEF